MNTTRSSSQDIIANNYVTSIISVVVKPEYLVEYEEWLEKINARVSKSTGFFSVDVIKPKNHTQPEYVIILKFNSYKNLKEWTDSIEYKKLINEAKIFQIHIDKDQQTQGMEMWFSRSDNQRYYPKPKYYKQVLMGLMVVYPLSTAIRMVMSPYIEDLPEAVGTFIIIFIMSSLMTWPVMPYLTRLLNGWLYPKPKKYSKK